MNTARYFEALMQADSEVLGEYPPAGETYHLIIGTQSLTQTSIVACRSIDLGSFTLFFPSLFTCFISKALGIFNPKDTQRVLHVHAKPSKSYASKNGQEAD